MKVKLDGRRQQLDGCPELQFLQHGGRRARENAFGELARVFQDPDVSTTMIYTHVLSRGVLGVRSPADRL
jgi:hypothetical protein